MRHFMSDRIISIGEAMVELAPEGGAIYRQSYAGDTFNTIWHIGQLLKGKARAGFVTGLGIDRFSTRFVAEMEADGLETTGILRIPDRSMGLYLIELDGVERSFHYWRKDSAARCLADDLPALQKAVKDASLIHVSGITLAILDPEARERLYRTVSDARQSGAVISFDPNIRPRLWSSPQECRDTIRRMAPLCDIALPSFDDEATLWGDTDPAATVRRMTDLGIAEIVVKNGPGPVTACFGGTTILQDTPAVDGVLDTTGAGDAFNAGYLAGRFRGADVSQSLTLAQSLSADVIRCLGARADGARLKKLIRGQALLNGSLF